MRRTLVLVIVVVPLLSLNAQAGDRVCPDCTGAMIRLELGDARSHHLCRFCPTVVHMEADGRTRVSTRRNGRRTRRIAGGLGDGARASRTFSPAEAVAIDPSRIVAPVKRPGHVISIPGQAISRPGHPIRRPSHAIKRPGHPITFRREQQGAIVMIGAPVRRPAHTVGRPGHAIGRPAHAITRPAHAIDRPGHAVSRPGHAISRPGHAIVRPDKATVSVWRRHARRIREKAKTRSGAGTRAGARKKRRARRQIRRQENKSQRRQPLNQHRRVGAERSGSAKNWSRVRSRSL